MAPLEACAARDALAKFIYSSQFDWLVNRICEAIGRGESARGRTIGILDIFGFEIFAKNQFEQLCINFANEKLQQFFNAHTFKKEEEVYAYERIQYEHVEYIDNQPVLDLIEKKQGILLLIDEEIKVPKGDDRTLMAKLTKVHGATAEFVKIMKRPQNFCVKHYAGQVEYETEGFLEKNKDKLADDQYSCLTASKFPFLASLFPANSDAASDKKTLGAKFAGQLNALMSALNATEPHYIRCIKPNPRKAPMEFEGMMSMLQLRYSGVFEAVKIRKQGYPFRLTHREFWLRYKCIMPQTHQWSGNVLDNVRFLVREMKQDANAVQIGTTKILYRAKQHKDMELRRNLAVEQVAIFIQKYSRRALAKQLEQRVKMIRPVIAKAIASRSIEQVKEALKRAANVGYDTTEILEAKRMLFVFEEEQRLEGVPLVLYWLPIIDVLAYRYIFQFYFKKICVGRYCYILFAQRFSPCFARKTPTSISTNSPRLSPAPMTSSCNLHLRINVARSTQRRVRFARRSIRTLRPRSAGACMSFRCVMTRREFPSFLSILIILFNLICLICLSFFSLDQNSGRGCDGRRYHARR
jgi:myosin heavy subunit